MKDVLFTMRSLGMENFKEEIKTLLTSIGELTPATLYTLNEYQKEAKTFMLPESNNEYYIALGLAGEVGEICNKMKKVIRGDANKEKLIESISDEIGDCMWYLSQIAEFYNTTLGEICLNNIAKLTKRKEEGTIKGSGDNR